jgi:hypothetical protein
MSDQQNRRKFLQLIGASGVTAATFASSAAGHDSTGGRSPKVDLWVPELKRCQKHCYGADYIVPLGATVDFEASYSGNGHLARIRKTATKSGKTKTVKECEKSKHHAVDTDDHSHGPFRDCENVHITFNKTGKHDVEAEFWSRDGIIDSNDHGGKGGGKRDCDAFESVDCETITIKVVRPEPKLELVEPTHPPAKVNERVIFQSGIENLYFDYDLIDDWRLETRRVPDELLPEPPGAPEDGKLFARLPKRTGTYIAVAVATIGKFEFTSNQLSFDVVDDDGGHHGDFEFKNPQVYTKTHGHKKYAYGKVTLKNKRKHRKSATVKLKAVGKNKHKKLDKKRVTVSGHDHKRVSLKGWYKRINKWSGDLGADDHGHKGYNKIVLTVNGDVIKTKHL